MSRRQVFLGRRVFLFSWGFHVRACLVMLNRGFPSVRPIQRNFLRFISYFYWQLISLGPHTVVGDFVCYLVSSSRVRLLVIPMTIFLQAYRSLVKPHSSVSVQFVTALMSSSHRARLTIPHS